MPSGLRRFQQTGDLHFVTFSCYRRQPKLATALTQETFDNHWNRRGVVISFA
jgi:putative transposase